MKHRLVEIWSKFRKSKYGNRFVVIVGIFALYVIFFDSNSSMKRWAVKSENRDIKDEIEKYDTKIKKDSVAIENLKYSSEDFEKFARENYNIKKANEDIYIIKEGN